MKIFSVITRVLVVVLGATLLIPATAIADGKGLMLGGGIYYGAVNEDVDGDFDFGDVKIDDSSGAYNLAIGYRFNKWIALDGGFWGLGEYKSNKGPLGEDFTVDTSAWTLGGMVSIPVWIIDIYGRLGAAWWDADANRAGSEDGTDPYYGLGVAFNLGGSLDIYGEWTRFDLNTDLDLLGVGIRWTF